MSGTTQSSTPISDALEAAANVFLVKSTIIMAAIEEFAKRNTSNITHLGQLASSFEALGNGLGIASVVAGTVEDGAKGSAKAAGSLVAGYYAYTYTAAGLAILDIGAAIPIIVAAGVGYVITKQAENGIETLINEVNDPNSPYYASDAIEKVMNLVTSMENAIQNNSNDGETPDQLLFDLLDRQIKKDVQDLVDLTTSLNSNGALDVLGTVSNFDIDKDMIVQQNGTVYTKIDNGGYVISTPDGAVYTKNSDGSGSVYNVNGTEYNYDSNGQMLTKLYTVVQNDTLSQIAKDKGITLQELLQVNPQISDPDVIQVGEQIVIPPSIIEQLSLNAILQQQQQAVESYGNTLRSETGGGVVGDNISGTSGDDTITGSSGSDTLKSGAGSDNLKGGDGNDILDGGEGADNLDGGTGHDTYYASAGDCITDSDGKGAIIFEGHLLGGGNPNAGATQWSDANGFQYNLDGSNLTITNPSSGNSISIQGFPGGGAGGGGAGGGGAGGSSGGTGASGTGGGSSGSGGFLGISTPGQAAAPTPANPYTAPPPPPRRYDPLVVDLDNDGVELVPMNAVNVYFDMDADGFAEKTGWVNGDDAFLAQDTNGDGKINPITELFGDMSTTGFSELASLDSNSDGIINTQDEGFGSLLLWQDKNMNGQTDEGELTSLATHGIVSLGMTAVADGQTRDGNTIVANSTFTRNDGSTGILSDVAFTIDQKNSIYRGGGPLRIEALFLPKLRGYGIVADLHYAMSQNETLLHLVQQLCSTGLMTVATLREKTKDILYQWAGVAGVDPTSRGGLIDARKLAFIEKFQGATFREGTGLDNPTAAYVPQLEQFWTSALEKTVVRLAIQGPLARYISGLSVNLDDDSIKVGSALPKIVENIIAHTPNSVEEGVLALSQAFLLLKQVANELNFSPTAIDAEFSTQLTGTAWEGMSDRFTHETVMGTLSADVLIGQGDGVNLAGMAGDDQLTGTAGRDLLMGGDGNDLLDGKDQFDDLRGGAGNDILGGDQNSADYYGCTLINGVYRGNDYRGGTGNDTLKGTAYSDRYYFNAGDGQDIIQEYSTNTSTATDSDQIILGTGIVANDL
ncbi:MAG: LysM peptidoglycan-binding domain-containing protein, partial [Magnetococcales bacterium]|nr:LysM peptidoglycan-binding domain-containing protein [Magnetococcales bacterium]